MSKQNFTPSGAAAGGCYACEKPETFFLVDDEKNIYETAIFTARQALRLNRALRVSGSNKRWIRKV